MNLYKDTAKLVKDLVGHEYLYFDTVLLLKKTPHSEPMRAWAVCISPAGELHLMDSNEEWHKVEQHETLLLPSLYQRLKAVERQYAKTA